LVVSSDFFRLFFRSNTVYNWLHIPLRVAGLFAHAKGKFDTKDTNILLDLADVMKLGGEFAGPAELSEDRTLLP
jgi:hypothetical protein